MLKLFLAVLFMSSVAIAASDDDACLRLCSKCVEDQSDLCREVVETCQCDISGDTENSSAAEPVQETASAPIIKTNFAPPQESGQKTDGAIMNVNFGYKGDSEYTATLQEDGSYKMEKKSSYAPLWIVLGVVSTVLIIAFALQ